MASIPSVVRRQHEITSEALRQCFCFRYGQLLQHGPWLCDDVGRNEEKLSTCRSRGHRLVRVTKEGRYANSAFGLGKFFFFLEGSLIFVLVNSTYYRSKGQQVGRQGELSGLAVDMRQGVRHLLPRLDSVGSIWLQQNSGAAACVGQFTLNTGRRGFADDANLKKTPLHDFHVENGGA